MTWNGTVATQPASQPHNYDVMFHFIDDVECLVIETS